MLKKRRNFLIVAISLISLIVGVAANYLWPSFTMPFTVGEPIEVVDYSPSNLNLFPGEMENITVLVQNHAPLNYTVILDFQLNNTAYQNSFVRFSDDLYTVPPGEHSLSGWLLVEPDAPSIDAALTISIKRVRPGVTPPSHADLLKEDWDSLTDWVVDSGAILVEINPLGQLHTYGGFAVHYMSFPQQFLIEFRLKVDSFGDGYAQIQVYTSQACRIFKIYADKIRLGTGNVGFEEFNTPTDNNWHVWTMIIDEATQETQIYKDAALLTTLTRAELGSGLTQRIYAGSERATTCETHWDYLYISTGLLP